MQHIPRKALTRRSNGYASVLRVFPEFVQTAIGVSRYGELLGFYSSSMESNQRNDMAWHSEFHLDQSPNYAWMIK